MHERDLGVPLMRILATPRMIAYELQEKGLPKKAVAALSYAQRAREVVSAARRQWDDNGKYND